VDATLFIAFVSTIVVLAYVGIFEQRAKGR